MPLDSEHIRRQFPFLQDAPSAVYLDSAAMAQVPGKVLEEMHAWERSSRSNVHRGMHQRAEVSTELYEQARNRVQHFIHATYSEEIIFTKGCTEGINLVARSWGEENVHAGDVIVLSILEHHSNIVPWQQLAARSGASIRWIDCDTAGNLQMSALQNLLKEGKVKLVAITAQSNVLGVRPDLPAIIAMAHEHGACVLVDAAQAVAHDRIDVQELSCDFLVFSGHKLYGPTGIGVLYGKRDILELMPPFLGGGMMIRNVTKDEYSPADLPARFEAGTPPIAAAIGLGTAIDWLSQYPWEDIQSHEQSLLQHAMHRLSSIKGLRILGSSNEQTSKRINDVHGCLSFTLASVHPHDLTDILGKKGIALRAGHHCCMPLHKKLGIVASTRLSVGIYNTTEEIDRCAEVITEAKTMLNP